LYSVISPLEYAQKIVLSGKFRLNVKFRQTSYAGQRIENLACDDQLLMNVGKHCTGIEAQAWLPSLNRQIH
jgi:hypothetical protein